MRRSGGLALLAVAAAWLAAGGVRAEPADRVRVDVMISRIGSEPGPVDPRAARLHQKLHAQFRYESLRVLKRERLVLSQDEVSSLRLPNGRQFRLRPLNVGSSSVLMAVSVEDTLQTDMRIAYRNLVAIRAGPYEGGSLVISLEPDR